MKSTEFLKRILDFEIWVVSGAVFASMLSTALLPWALVIILLFFPLRRLKTGQWVTRTPVDWGVLALVLCLPITLWVTLFPDLTRIQVYRLLVGIGFFYALVSWTVSQVRLRWLVTATLLANLGLLVGSVFSVEWTRSKLTFLPSRFYEPFSLLVTDTINPNVLAGIIVVLFPFGLAYLFAKWNSLHWAERGLAFLISLGSLIVVVLTQSRSALLAVLTAGMVFLLLRWRWGWGMVLILAGSASGAVFFFSEQLRYPLILLRRGLISLGEREEIWSRAVHMLRDFSLTGVGMGSFTKITDTMYPFSTKQPGTVSHAHNLLLQIGVDLGLPGLLAWLFIFGGVCWTAWRLYRYGRTHPNAWAHTLGIAILTSQVALFTNGLTDAVTWGQVRPAPLVWMIWGVGLSAWRLLATPTQAH